MQEEKGLKKSQKADANVDQPYKRSIIPTTLTIGVGFVGLAAFGPVGGAIAIGGAILGAGAFFSIKKEKSERSQVAKKLPILFAATQELAHLTLEANRLEELDISLLLADSSTWAQKPENFHHQAYTCYKKTTVFKAIYDKYREKDVEVQQAIAVIKEAIKNGSDREKFQEWWDQSIAENELNLCQFLSKLKAVYPNLVPASLNLHLDPSLKHIDEIKQKYTTALEATAPYREAYLEGMQPSLDTLAMMIANSLINIYTLESRGYRSHQAQKMSEAIHKQVIEQTISIVNQRICTQKIYPFLEMDKVYYLLLAIVDPNFRLKMHAFNFKIKDETLQSMHVLIKIIENTIDNNVDKESTVDQVHSLADVFGPLIEPAMKIKLVKFFSEEKEEIKIQVVKQALVQIIQLTILESSLDANSQAPHQALLEICREIGRTAGPKMTDAVRDSLNTFSDILYAEPEVTAKVLTFTSSFQKVAGYFSSWVVGTPTFTTANAHHTPPGTQNTQIVGLASPISGSKLH